MKTIATNLRSWFGVFLTAATCLSRTMQSATIPVGLSVAEQSQESDRQGSRGIHPKSPAATIKNENKPT